MVLKTWLAPWAYVASVTYHDMFWHPALREGEDGAVLESPWGKLFANWGRVKANELGFPDVGDANPQLIQMGMKHFPRACALIGMAVAESPELAGSPAAARRAPLSPSLTSAPLTASEVGQAGKERLVDAVASGGDVGIDVVVLHATGSFRRQSFRSLLLRS